MNVIYIISKYITVIGSFLKGFWEQLFCKILNIPVQDARYLQANELCGHVEHDFTKSKLITFLLCYLPGFMNRLFGYGMVTAGYFGLFYLRVPYNTVIFWVYLVFLYIGVSLFCNIAPLYEDALNNWSLLYAKESKTNVFVKIIAFIPSVFMLVASWMEKYALSLLVWIAAILVGIFVF